MEAVQNLAPHQQKLFMKEMEQLQLKDSLTYVIIFYVHNKEKQQHPQFYFGIPNLLTHEFFFCIFPAAVAVADVLSFGGGLIFT